MNNYAARGTQNLKNLHEMVFIYNAVMDGWTVRKLRNGKVRFKKNNNVVSERRAPSRYVTEENEHHQIHRYDLELEQFIRNNTQVSRVFSGARQQEQEQ